MNYESLLENAYKRIEPVKESKRLEVLKVEGHHEGTKTIITNFSAVVSSLRRNPEHIMKFLSKELASSGEISGDRLILSRKLSSKEVNDKINKYFNQYIVCSKCKKPDTELEEGNKLFVKCLACGAKVEVHKV